MKRNENFDDDKLMIDVVDYAFVQWLVRRHLYSAFSSHFLHFRHSKEDFRSALSRHIRYSVCDDFAQVKTFLFTAFPFVLTPEGYDFWNKHSKDWARFCNKFLKAF